MVLMVILDSKGKLLFIIPREDTDEKVKKVDFLVIDNDVYKIIRTTIADHYDYSMTVLRHYVTKDFVEDMIPFDIDKKYHYDSKVTKEDIY